MEAQGYPLRREASDAADHKQQVYSLRRDREGNILLAPAPPFSLLTLRERNAVLWPFVTDNISGKANGKTTKISPKGPL